MTDLGFKTDCQKVDFDTKKSQIFGKGRGISVKNQLKGSAGARLLFQESRPSQGSTLGGKSGQSPPSCMGNPPAVAPIYGKPIESRSRFSGVDRASCSRSIAPVLKAGAGVCRSRQFDTRRCFGRRRSQKSASCEMLLQLIGEPHL